MADDVGNRAGPRNTCSNINADGSVLQPLCVASATTRVHLDYAVPRPHQRWLGMDVPISGRFAVLLFVTATWPFLLSLTSLEMLYMRPLFHLLISPLTLGFGAGVFFFRAAMVKPAEPPTRQQRRFARRRAFGILVVSVSFIALHAAGLPLRLMFALHDPLFNAARLDTEQTLAPGAEKPCGSIGLFDVSAVRRGQDGEVGFNVGGSSIYFDPTPATYDILFYPPGNGGDLLGDWHWEATD